MDGPLPSTRGARSAWPLVSWLPRRLGPALLALAGLFLLGGPAGAGDAPPESPGAALARLEREYGAALARHDPKTYETQRRVLTEIADLETPAARMALRGLLQTYGAGGDRIRTLHLLRAIVRRGRAVDLDEVIRYVERARDPLLFESLGEVLSHALRESARQHVRAHALPRATPGVKVQLLAALGIWGEPGTTLVVLPYLRSEHLRVRIEAIGALGMLQDPAALGVLGPFASPKAETDWRVRRGVVRALGMIGRRAPKATATRVLGTLLRVLPRESDPRVLEMHAQALGMLGLPGAVEALIEGLERSAPTNLRLADAYASALQRISGKPLGLDVDLWKSWWKVMKGQPLERIEQSGGGGTAAGVRYYGFPVRSSKVVFVLDISRSMGWNERLVTAKDELERTISRLPAATRFNILAYSDDVRSWKPKLTEARPGNVRSALAFVSRQRPDNGTNSYGALAAAFRDPAVDTIFFLTDGHPTVGDLVDPELILAAVRTWNRFRDVRLHTIALTRGAPPPAFAGREDPQTASAFMKRLAEQNDGRFREIR